MVDKIGGLHEKDYTELNLRSFQNQCNPLSNIYM